MKLALSGEVLATFPTKNGKAVKVIVRDSALRNAVVLLPSSVKAPEVGETLAVDVRASVDHAADGHLLQSVTYMYADWPRPAGQEG